MTSTSKTSHSKSRTGCLRCKKRRIKCDETRPSCIRCEEKAYQCPGYSRVLRWSTKHEVGAPSTVGSLEADHLFHKSPVLALSDLPHEGRWSTLDDDSISPFNPQHSELELVTFLDGSDTVLEEPQPNQFPQGDVSTSLLDDDVMTDNIINPFPPFAEETILETLPAFEHGASFTVDDYDTVPANRLPGEGLSLISNVERRSGSTADFTQPHIIQIAPDPSSAVMHMPSALCSYFFKEVITLYCAWDSASNNLRVLTEQLWQHSQPLYHTIQSMAAACLADDFPHLSSIATKEHACAMECLKKSSSGGLASGKENFLSLTLLGHTASWHQPTDLATEYYKAASTILKDWPKAECQDDTYTFFRGSLKYWEMLLSFLTDSSDVRDSEVTSFAGPVKTLEGALPHPYFGTSRDSVSLLGEVGNLIFRFRKRMSKMSFMSEADVWAFRRALAEAGNVEKKLLAYRPVDPALVLDPGDPRTPLAHHQLMDEAYRCTGLLQLYRVFPDLLNQRYQPWTETELLDPRPAIKIPTEEERNSWLTRLAMHILAMIKEIPFESRTRSSQPFILVAVSHELRLNPNGTPVANFKDDQLDQFFIEVARARKFVSSRLAAYMHILPLRKIRKIFDLVSSIWSELDAGSNNIYWVDVAFNKRLGTMMG